MFLLLHYYHRIVTINQGRKRRLGFGSNMKSSFTVQRSEEIFPDEVRHLVKQTSSISSDGDGSQDGDRFFNFIFIDDSVVLIMKLRNLYIKLSIISMCLLLKLH